MGILALSTARNDQGSAIETDLFVTKAEDTFDGACQPGALTRNSSVEASALLADTHATVSNTLLGGNTARSKLLRPSRAGRDRKP
jgi:hypothetical protein